MELRTMPMHIEENAISHADGEANTFLSTKPSVVFCAASSAVSSAVWNSKPALAGESSTNFQLKKNIAARIAAGIQKHHCQGRNLMMNGEAAKANSRPLWIMMPKMPANLPRSRRWNQAALILTME